LNSLFRNRDRFENAAHYSIHLWTSESNKIYLLPFDGLSKENSACHSDSQPCFLGGDFIEDGFAGDALSKCRWSDLIDFEGDLDRCLALLGEPERESC
jgi:hypothetical protein